MSQHHNKTAQRATEQGFALLITLVVVSVVLAVGLSMLFITTKQYVLAVTAIESEKAFQAAQVGLECLRYNRSLPATREDLLNGGGAPDIRCANEPHFSANSSNTPIDSMSSDAFRYWTYSYSYKYGIKDASGQVASCTEPTIFITDFREYNPANPADREFTLTVVGQGLNEMKCTAGTVCTAIFAKGYNRPCDNTSLNSIFTIQREITVQY